MFRLIFISSAVLNQVICQPYLQSDQLAGFHRPDLIQPVHPGEDRMFSKYFSMFFIMVQLFIDQLVLQVIFHNLSGSCKNLLQATGFKQLLVSCPIGMISRDLISYQYLQLRRAAGIPQKRELLADLNRWDGFYLYPFTAGSGS